MSYYSHGPGKVPNVLLYSHVEGKELTLYNVCLTRRRASSPRTRKYDRGLSTLLHDQLHWLNVPERVEYKLAVTVRRCLENKAPRYLVECCTPVADVASRHRRSANLHRLTVPRYRRSTNGRRAFSVSRSGSHLPVELREPTVSCGDFRRTLKTILFARY